MAKELKKRSEIEEKYKWNLEDLIPSGEALSALISDVTGMIPEYENFRGKLGDSEKELARFLMFDECLDEKLSRLFAYAQQKSDEDTSDGEYQALVSRVQDLARKAMAASSFAEPEILSIPDETMKVYLNSEELSLYRKQLKRLLAKKEHMLSGPQEQILAQSMEATQGASAIFNLLNNADLKFPDIKDENGAEVELTHGRYNMFLESSDREVRRNAFHAYYSAYRQFGGTVAAILESNIRQACFYSRVRKYPSTRAYYLAENEIPETVYDNLIEGVHSHMDLLHRYVSLRKKLMEVRELHMYDLYVPLVPDSNKPCPYEEAKRLIIEALTPLGEEYVETVKQGFENRWIDVYENQGKRSGGYSNCVYGVHPYVLLSYDDTLSSALVVAHEMGHSMHSWYSNGNQPYTYAGYKIFVAEVASTCNEALLLQHLIKQSKSREEKRYLINQFLERFRLVMFRQTMFAEFELSAHRMAWDGTPLTKDTLCEIYHRLNEQYFGEDITVDSDIDYEWARIPHFYRPFYVYQYATGFAAAVAISRKILSGDKEVLDGYFRFLKGGCSTTPIELLRLCGIDMEKPEVVEEALKVFEELLDEFEKEEC